VKRIMKIEHHYLFKIHGVRYATLMMMMKKRIIVPPTHQQEGDALLVM